MRRKTIYKLRRVIALIVAFGGTASFLIFNANNWRYDLQPTSSTNVTIKNEEGSSKTDELNRFSDSSSGEPILAKTVLETLEIKGRSPKTDYDRTEFYTTWPTVDGCNLRQKIIRREFGETAILKGCDVISGEYYEPYTGKILNFSDKSEISKNIQIDHVVALSDAWQKGAKYLDRDTRYQIATDPLNLIAVDSAANQQKSDGDAATWLPPNKSFRCEYIARQISVKARYGLWITEAEHDVMNHILETCPDQIAY